MLLQLFISFIDEKVKTFNMANLLIECKVVEIFATHCSILKISSFLIKVIKT